MRAANLRLQLTALGQPRQIPIRSQHFNLIACTCCGFGYHREDMEALLWICLPVLVAAGSALLAFYIMQARLDVAVAKEREAVSEARLLLESHKKAMAETPKPPPQQPQPQHP